MKKLLYILAAALLCINLQAQRPGSDLGEVIEDMIRQHPELRLQDIYKSFHQDRFGPGHMIASRESASDYLDRELAQCHEWKDPQPVEAVGAEGNYVRVSLLYVKSGMMDRDAYLDAFIAGVKPLRRADYVSWKREWAAIAEAAKAFNIPDYDKDRAMIDAALEESDGKLVLHHSEAYSKAYEPHYRIIERSRYEQLMRSTTYRAVEVDQFETAIAAPEIVIVDVRTAAEHAQGHIPGTDLNLDVQQGDFMAKAMESVPAGSTVAIYCRSGRRSKTAAKMLQSCGYRVVELDKGFNAWSERH